MPFDDAGRPVFDKSLPTLPSITEQGQRRRQLSDRWMAEYGREPEFHLDLAHHKMVERDQCLHNIAKNGEAGQVGYVEDWARWWSVLDRGLAEHVAKASELSGQPEQEAER